MKHSGPKPWAKKKNTTTRPWQTAAWRKRRKELIAGKTHCAWCSVEFDPPNKPAVLHHVHDCFFDYKNEDGSPDWEAYLNAPETDLAIICKGCHIVWTRDGEKRGTPETTCACGEFKRSYYPTCFACRSLTPETTCACGEFKKPHFPTCFTCSRSPVADWLVPGVRTRRFL